MQKFTMAALVAAVLAGCSSAPPEPQVTTYSYESKVHSGTVNVTEKQYTSDVVKCDSNWRDGQLYTPKGIIPMGHDHLNYVINLYADGQEEKTYTLDVPQDLGDRVLAKDYQQAKEYMLQAESNGLVQQGGHFAYPEGYYLRISKPSVKGWDFVSCIGIDHMYVLDSDLQASDNPPIQLDRVVVPFAMDQVNQPVKVSFGSKIQHTAEIRVQP
ncbi:hypothetical protein [Pseudomonas putida]|uniref:Lipoprotein n=1 Tax=Pseudomonas putida TaxID=303 RepID=A0A7V8EFT8_PSEPU|nr:hypothetical protein [Pseudomonas putida]KAF0254040.1 hypothetical protein GN299_15335 [Pseudomonas putida]